MPSKNHGDESFEASINFFAAIDAHGQFYGPNRYLLGVFPFPGKIMKKNDYWLSIEVDLSLSESFWLSCVVDCYSNFHVFS